MLCESEAVVRNIIELLKDVEKALLPVSIVIRDVRKESFSFVVYMIDTCLCLQMGYAAT